MHIDKEDISPKNDVLALFLALLFGTYGAHRFYAGKFLSGCIYLFVGNIYVLFDILQFFGVPLVTNLFINILFYAIPGIMILYDIFAIVTGSFSDSNGKLIVNRAIKEEAGAFDKNTDWVTDVIITICLFLLYVDLKYILLPLFI